MTDPTRVSALCARLTLPLASSHPTTHTEATDDRGVAIDAWIRLARAGWCVTLWPRDGRVVCSVPTPV